MDIGHGTLTYIESADREIILRYSWRRIEKEVDYFFWCILSVSPITTQLSKEELSSLFINRI